MVEVTFFLNYYLTQEIKDFVNKTKKLIERKQTDFFTRLAF